MNLHSDAFNLKCNLSLPNLVLVSEFRQEFEKRVAFSQSIDPNNFSKNINRETSTLTVTVKKFKNKDIGDETF